MTAETIEMIEAFEAKLNAAPKMTKRSFSMYAGNGYRSLVQYAKDGGRDQEVANLLLASADLSLQLAIGGPRIILGKS